MTTYWASCDKFTVRVDVDDAGIVTDTAPIVRKFVGQKWDNLRRWMEGLGGLTRNPPGVGRVRQ